MSNKQTTREQRQHERVELELGVVAVFRTENNVFPGQILDISLGGLAFFYFDGEEWSNETEEYVHIFGEDLNLENIPLQTVSDFTIIEENNPIYEKATQLHYASGKVRRRGIKFGKLTAEQKEKLEEFIKNIIKSSKNKE